MRAWYTKLVARDVCAAARELAGNWQQFKDFGWNAEPAVHPEDYAILYLSNRDSDCLEESNAAAILLELSEHSGSIADGDEIEEQSHRHWAVGHVDGIVIRCVNEYGEPTAAFQALYAIAERLDEYPIQDEDDFSEREQATANLTWKNCYSPAERIDYIRANRSQFEFHGLADLMGCVRGNYFAGSPSELLG